MTSEQKRDYYEVLGISRTASKSELRAAYRRLARQYHPDVNEAADAEVRFKEINEAYQVLSDDEKRAVYDRYGHAGLDQADRGFDGFGFGGFEDIFDEFFGFGSRRRGGGRSPKRGSDLRYDLEIDFEEAVFGCDRVIRVSRMETCPHCGGSGAEPGSEPERCPECNGTGQIRRTQQSIFGSFVNVTTCPRCGGTGQIITEPCSECRGERRVERIRDLEVHIPAGIEDGMRLRLAGEGESGLDGGPAGNVYVIVHVAPHEFFQRRNDDILLNVNINIAQATLGARIKIPTLTGEEELVIAPGTQAGTVKRLKSKGVPHLRGSRRGDQVIIINVRVPTDLTAEQREILEALSETLGSEMKPGVERGFLDRVKDALGI